MYLQNSLTILAVIHTINALRSYTIELLSYEQNYNPHFYQVNTIQMSNVSGLLALNGSTVFRRDVDEIDLLIMITAIDGKRPKPWVLLNVKLDLCKIIDVGRKRSMNLLYFAIESMRSDSNLIPNKCPFKKDVDYYAKHLHPDSEKFPPYMPEMKTKVFIKALCKSILVYESNTTVIAQTKTRSNVKKS